MFNAKRNKGGIRPDKLKVLLESSYLSQKAAAERLKPMGFTLDPELSSMETKVFYKEKSGKPFVLQRGSTTLEDWAVSDIALATGLEKYTRRFQKAKRTTELVREKYGRDPVTIGHSLGGSLAIQSGTKAGINAYNPGVGLAGLGTTIPKNSHILRTHADPVSALTFTQKDPHHNLKQIKQDHVGSSWFSPPAPLMSPAFNIISTAVSAHNIKNI